MVFCLGLRNTLLRYQARWPIGTRQRVWLDVLLYTGLRRGDAVRFGRQHVKDCIGTIKTEKSGFTMTVTLPILPVLAETLAAGPCGDLTFIAGERGQPLTKESFGNLFRDACREASVPGSAHGVRKIAATTAANNGATVAQLEALFGWTGGTMASLYSAPLIVGAWHWMQHQSLRTQNEHLFPHLRERCGRQSGNRNENIANFSSGGGRSRSRTRLLSQFPC
jgi:integrase